MDAYNQQVKQINQNLQHLKRTGASYDRVLGRIDGVIQKLEKALFVHNQQKNDLIREKQKQDEYLSKLKPNTEVYKEKMKRQTESIESFSNIAKATLGNTTFATLKDVKQDKAVDELFSFLYTILYNETEASYDFAKFKKVALKDDINDFKKRLAMFSVIKLDQRSRERLDQIKSADYSANQDNEDLYSLLAWLEYNYEAFVALKEKEQASTMIVDLSNKEKKYKGHSENTKLLLGDLDQIIHYCEEHLEHVRLYKRKLEETNDHFKRTQHYGPVRDNMGKIFAAVDGFQGNDVIENLDIQIGSKVNGV